MEGGMLTRIGRVVRVEAGGVMVRFERPAACTGCGACARDQKTTTVFALGSARVDDIVSVQMPKGKPKRAAWPNNLAMVLGFAGGLLLGYLIRATELVMVLGGALGLAASFAVLWAVDRQQGREANGQARLLLINDPQVMGTYQKLSTCPKARGWIG